MRKETKIALLLLSVCLVMRSFTVIPSLHFVQGMLTGLSLVMFLVGMLPNEMYLKLKSTKLKSIKNQG